MDIKIIVATHKKIKLPTDEIYLPLQLGAANSESIGIQGDNQGINISSRHNMFAELTGLYWAWKNLQAYYIGLVHYRRFFKGNGVEGVQNIANRYDIEKLLCQAPILLPVKRNYYLETVYSQFAHAHNVQNLDLAGEIVQEKYPEYYPAFVNLKHRRATHICNMCIMRTDYFSEYCEWLFDILFAVGMRMSFNQEARCLGYIGERLLDIWLETRKIKYVESKIVCFGVENSFIKGMKMLKRKFWQ